MKITTMQPFANYILTKEIIALLIISLFLFLLLLLLPVTSIWKQIISYEISIPVLMATVVSSYLLPLLWLLMRGKGAHGGCERSAGDVYSSMAPDLTSDVLEGNKTQHISTQCRIRRCSQCQETAECYCCTCENDLCLRCKATHTFDLDHMHHDVVMYCNVYEFITKQDPCVRHSDRYLKRYCFSCKLPFCLKCSEHLKHNNLGIKTAYEMYREKHKDVYHTIRNVTLYQRCFFLERIKNDVRRSEKGISIHHLVQRIKKTIDSKICNDNVSHKKSFLRLQRLQEEKTLKKHISSLEKYEHAFEQAACKPVQLLLYLNKTDVYQIKDSYKFRGHTLPSLTEEIDLKDVASLLSNALKIKKRKRKKISAQCKQRKCSQCQEDTEFYCKTCKHDLCLKCKERHVIDLDTFHHNVVIYRERYEFIRTERCVKHPDEIYRIYCQSCKLPFCLKCKGCIKPQNIDIISAYKSYRQKYKGIFHSIRSKTLPYSYIHLARFKDGIKNCHKEMLNFQLEMATKAQRLQDQIGTVVYDMKILHKRLMHSMQQTKRNQVSIEKYEHRSEKLIQRPIKFLFFHKKNPFPMITDIPNITKQHLLSLYDKINKKKLIKLLSEIQNRETGERHVKNESVLKLIPQPVFYRSITVKVVNGILHISCVTPDKVWVNDRNNLLLINIEGDILHHLRDINSYTGSHTVNSVGDLIYIDGNNNITKLSNDRKTRCTLVKKVQSRVAPCVFCSPINNDLLVGITAKMPGLSSKLLRYSKTGKLIKTIQKNSRGLKLYENPLYVTENLNGDVIVSDKSCGVVVTNREGRHRFSYTGYPEGSRIEPYGICTDVLSHILVYDRKSSKIQILDKDGNFLSKIQITQRGVRSPWSLCFDNKTHHLWVGSIYIFNEDAPFTNTVFMCVYRFIEKRRYLKEDAEDRMRKV